MQVYTIVIKEQRMVTMREGEEAREARGEKKRRVKEEQELNRNSKAFPGLPMRIIKCFTRYPRVSILFKRHQAPP
jgi:hypothetical protein